MLIWLKNQGKVRYRTFQLRPKPPTPEPETKSSKSSPEKEPPADKQLRRSKTKKEKDEKLRKAFAAFDKDGGGTIDKDELRAVLESLGQKLCWV